MADCLKSNLSVQEPIYCEDGSGNIIEDTAMYSWMSVRAAGPNVLKDTTLCGQTRILDPVAPTQAFFQIYTLNPMATSLPAQATYYAFGNDNYATRTWNLKWEGSQSNDELNIFNWVGSGNPTIAPQGALALTNISGRNIVAKLTLTASVAMPSDFQGLEMVFKVGLWQSQVEATPLPSDASIQTSRMVLPVGTGDQNEISITCDFITIMVPDDIVQPVINVAYGPVTSTSITNANLVAEFIEFYEGDTEAGLPGGTLPPPPPPG